MDTRSSNSSPGKNRISVALCTYNGEQFLAKQLASIEKQSRLPDELILCDDRSSDGTVGIAETFAASAPFPVKVIVNRENLGSTMNFEKAIRACNGDLIALSDQDDIWHVMRLESCEREFLMHPEAGLVFSDANIIDGQDCAMGTRLWQTFQFTEEKRLQLLAGEYELCVKSRFVTGATMMFRASLRDRCLPVGPGWIHDEWIAATTAIFADVRPIDVPLVFYRTHACQQVGVGPRRLSNRERMQEWWDLLTSEERVKKYWGQLEKDRRAIETLCDALLELPLEGRERVRFRAYQRYLRFLSRRYYLSSRRIGRLYPVLSNFSQYSRYVRGWRTAVKDLVLNRPK